MFESLLGNVPMVFRVAAALIDYLIKAAVNYKDTPEGASEWNDFTSLYETSINNDANENVSFGSEDAGQSPSQGPRVVVSAVNRKSSNIVQS